MFGAHYSSHSRPSQIGFAPAVVKVTSPAPNWGTHVHKLTSGQKVPELKHDVQGADARQRIGSTFFPGKNVFRRASTVRGGGGRRRTGGGGGGHPHHATSKPQSPAIRKTSAALTAADIPERKLQKKIRHGKGTTVVGTGSTDKVMEQRILALSCGGRLVLLGDFATAGGVGRVVPWIARPEHSNAPCYCLLLCRMRGGAGEARTHHPAPRLHSKGIGEERRFRSRFSKD